MSQDQPVKRRPGRPKGSKTVINKHWIAPLLAQVNAPGRFKQLIGSKNERIVLETLRYLHDHIWGRAAQPLVGPDNGPIETDQHIDIVFHHADKDKKAGE